MTTPLRAEGPNAEQIEYWNATSGPKWVALQEAVDERIASFGELALDRAQISAGERVLDVGCGCGATCLALASRVGPGGSVLGVDVSTVMLARARERAREAGLAQVSFANADAQTEWFDAGARDLAFSRFGVMFFSDPPRAFANLRRALRPQGRVVFVCWRGIAENPWLRVPLQALASFLTLPAPPPPGAPGPFSFADPARVREILEQAGFESPEITPHELPLRLGGGEGLDEAVSFAVSVGPAGRILDEAGDQHRARADQVLRAALAPYASKDGVMLGGAVWVVSANNPG